MNKIRIENIEDQVMDPVVSDQENPLGHLLGLLSTLPEIREEKVFHARRQIHQQDSQMEQRLDIALDRVLEELISEG